MPKVPERSREQQVAAAMGGLCFAGSLVYFGLAYAYRFGQDAGASTPAAPPIVTDILLFAAFGVHHSLFARAGMKARVRAVVPPEMDRTVYVVVASVLFAVMTACWQLIPGTWWRVEGAGASVLRLVAFGGGVLAVAAGRLVHPLELAGIRRAAAAPAASPAAPIHRGPYRVVRHPLYLAWLLAVWAAPVMTSTRLLIAVLSAVYVLIAIPLEERDLRRFFGASYDAYAAAVRYRLIPGLY